MIICTRCGSGNPPGANYCKNCNAMLPKMVQSEAVAHKKITTRYLQLKNAGEQAKCGEMTVEEYAEFLDNISRILSEREVEIRSIIENEIPPEAMDDFAEELENGIAGIDNYNEGIGHMKLFVDDLNPDHIDYGLELIYQGNELINEAMRINRQNRLKMEEMQI